MAEQRRLAELDRMFRRVADAAESRLPQAPPGTDPSLVRLFSVPQMNKAYEEPVKKLLKELANAKLAIHGQNAMGRHPASAAEASPPEASELGASSGLFVTGVACVG